MSEGVAFQNIRAYWLTLVVSLGMVIFGYNMPIAGDVETRSSIKDANVHFNMIFLLQAGAFFGSLGSAPMADWLGHRRTLMTLLVIFSIGTLLIAEAEQDRGIYAGRVVSGIGIGGISAVSLAYVSECSPKEVRGRTIGLLMVSRATGAVVSYLVNLDVGFHLENRQNVEKVSSALQLILAGLMFMGLLTVKESPRWLASMERSQEATVNLAYFRQLPRNSPQIRREMAEIEAAACKGFPIREAFFGHGNFIRFVVAFVLCLFQQWSGEASIGFYAPQIFSSIGYMGKYPSLFSCIYGAFRMVSTLLAVLSFVDTLGRKLSLFISAMGMGVALFAVGAILKTHPTHPVPSHHAQRPASSTMASMIYLFVCFFSLGVGPTPWIYVSEIFPTRTRHYGLAIASATYWLFDFVVTKNTPTLVADLGCNFFFVLAAINIGGIAVFSLFLPETKGCSLEEMDIIFGAVSVEARETSIKMQERRLQIVPPWF